MKPVNAFLDAVRDNFKRLVMNPLARAVNFLTGGRLSPSVITITSLVMHVPVAWLISQGYFGYAAVGLLVFGLFDALDGELARLQNKATPSGMLLDSITDRMKEVLLYIGIAYVLVLMNEPYYAAWAVAACGGSLLVSYGNAWGEAVAARFQTESHTMNKSFRGSLMRFEVRMFTLLLGLVFNQLALTTVVIAVLAWLSAFDRLFVIRKSL